MSLSEEERRRLERLEQELAATDPGLDQDLQTGGLGRRAASFAVYGVLTVIAGIVLVITGIVTNLTVVGATGFLLMLVGGNWFGSSLSLRKTSRRL